MPDCPADSRRVKSACRRRYAISYADPWPSVRSLGIRHLRENAEEDQGSAGISEPVRT
jgi:hypothetical protein